jgi:choline dehydrogenase
MLMRTPRRLPARTRPRDTRDLIRQVESGSITRRDLLKLFGISAAAFGAHAITGCGTRPPAYDYVIVGAGSAGCTLAARLLADSQASVLLIEAGGANDRQEVHDFTQSYRLTQPGSPIDWAFKSEPQPALLNKPQSFSCGKVVGGSSSINGMVWVNGNRADYDAWAAAGCAGWDAASIRPSMQALTGPIRPSTELTARNAFCHATIDAAVKMGYPFNPDYNGEEQFGVGFTQLNVVNGVRQDAFTAFLAKYLGDPRLTLMTDARVKRLVFDSAQTIDHVLIDAKGRDVIVAANREVIVCTGTINTPHLLQLSGIGPASDLERHGITVIANVPGVGQNLHDHLMSVVVKKLRKPEPATHITAMDVNIFTGQSLVPGAPRYEVQTYYMRYGWGPYPPETIGFGVMNLHPTSRGFVTLRSADHRTPPIIQPNFLQTADDLDIAVEGYEMVRALIHAPGLRDWLVDEEAVPGPNVKTKEQLIAAIRQYSESDFHAVGTCRMGTDDLAVVDPRLRVRGVKGLRLASAAIMPAIPSANTNAPAMMIGDRCGRLLLDRT